MRVRRKLACVLHIPRAERILRPKVTAKDQLPLSIRTKIAGLQSVLYFDNWPWLIAQRCLDRKTGLVTYRKKGFEILVDHHGGDEAGTRSCIVSDMYSRYLSFLELPDSVNVLDLGANGGGFPLMLRLRGIKLKKVVCIEMNPPTASRLAVNLSLNIGSAAVTVNAALCDENSRGSEVVLKENRGSTSESIFRDQAGSGEASYFVPTITLSAACSKYFSGMRIDICKVDIEGAEYEVFESTSDEVLAKFRYLLIELHNPLRNARFLERLSALGFREMTDRSNSKTSAETEVRAFQGPKLDDLQAKDKFRTTCLRA